MIAYNLKASASEDIRTSYAKLLRDIKHLTALKATIEKEIRAGGFSESFKLEAPSVTMFVPNNLWKEALGEEWVKQNERPQNKSAVIVPK